MKPAARSIKTVRAAGIAALAAALLLVQACGKGGGQELPLPAVTVVQPVKQPVTDYLMFTGNADAVDTVQLEARIPGFLTAVNFKDGDVVKEDDVLFEIEPEAYAADVKLAQASVDGAKAELLRANLEYNRQLDLVKKNAVAVSDVERWRAQRDSAQADLDKSQAQLDNAQIEFSYTQVKAPFDGRIDRRLKDPGNLVGVGAPTPLTVIRRLDPIYVYFSINEKDLVKVRHPRAADENHKRLAFAAIEGEEGYPHKGEIDFASSSLDAGTGTLLLRAVFENPPMGALPRILPGMFIRLRVPVHRRPHALLVPDRAIGVDQSGRYVLTVDPQGVVDKKPVKIGALEGALRVIEEGLQGGELVVVNGLQQARPGGKVRPIQQQDQSQAQAAPAAPVQAK